MTDDCAHPKTTNHVKQQGTEVVTWTTCDDCGATLRSSRRNAYVRRRR